jgi:DNA-binding NarL/FixJ family response regulator
VRTDPAALSAAAREELRQTYAELRSIAAAVDDPQLRSRLARLERRVAALSRDTEGTPMLIDKKLSPREIDVLACAALGATNAEIASTLDLREGTVKSYLQAAMAKLDASTRHAAVVAARRAGILP